jgi:acetyltransferase-like isoleucine patch superfamily enzyme
MTTKYHEFKPKISEKAKLVGRGQIEIGAFTVIEDYVLIDSGLNSRSHISIGKRCKIKQGAILRSYGGCIIIGDRTTIGEYTIIAGHGGVNIGNTCEIAGHCYISAQNHILINNEIIRFQGETSKGIDIEDNVLVSGNCMIVDGVKIGYGSVIGAGSVVTKSIPINKICCGDPCEILYDRDEPFWTSKIAMEDE